MIKEIIDQFYLDRERSKNRGQTKFWISEAGACPRAIFFKFKEMPQKERDATTLRKFDHGDYIHQRIRRVLFSKGIVQASEIDIDPQADISGRADAIVNIKGELYVVDIKSMDGRIFNNLMEPKLEDTYQIQLYLHFFKIKKGVLLYESKDTQEIKEYLISYNPELSQNLLNNLKSLKSRIEENTLPARLSDYPVNWRCKFCLFAEICAISDAGEMKWEDFKLRIEAMDK